MQKSIFAYGSHKGPKIYFYMWVSWVVCMWKYFPLIHNFIFLLSLSLLTTSIFFTSPPLSLPLQIFTSLSSLSLLSFPFPSLFLSSPPLSRRHRGPPSHGSVVGDDGGRWGQQMMTARAAWVQHGSGRRRRQSRVWVFFLFIFAEFIFACGRYRWPHAKNGFLHEFALPACENPDFCIPFGACGCFGHMQNSLLPACKNDLGSSDTTWSLICYFLQVELVIICLLIDVSNSYLVKFFT